MMINSTLRHFLEFHKGTVNIAAHAIGFLGLFYGIYKFDWVLFAVFLAILEIGHVYNHFTGIKPYDFRPKVLFWRVAIFAVVVALFYFVSRYFLNA